MTASAACDHTNPTADMRTGWQHGHATANGLSQPSYKFFACDPGGGLQPKVLTLFQEKRRRRFESERGAEPGVIAQARMGVEWQM